MARIPFLRSMLAPLSFSLIASKTNAEFDILALPAADSSLDLILLGILMTNLASMP